MLDQLYKIAGIIVAAAILIGGVFYLARLDADVRYLQRDVAELQADVAKLQADVAELQAQVADVQRNQALILDILRGLAADAQQPQSTALDGLGGGSLPLHCVAAASHYGHTIPLAVIPARAGMTDLCRNRCGAKLTIDKRGRGR